MSTDDNTWEERIRSATTLVREDPHALYSAIRSRLTESGVDVAHSLFTDVAEEDVDAEGGIVVTPDKKVLRFDYGFHGVGVLNGHLRLQDWTDIYREGYASRQVAIALRMLEQDRSQHGARIAAHP